MKKNVKKNELIKKIVSLEWDMFTSVKNVNNRASCQNDAEGFCKYRCAQMFIWNEQVLSSYLEDLQIAQQEKNNLIAIKYAYMMKYTYWQEFLALQDSLPVITADKTELLAKIMLYFKKWQQEVEKLYPNIVKNSRGFEGLQKGTTSMMYLEAELQTYSQATLTQCYKVILDTANQNKNLIEQNFINLAKIGKYSSAMDLEKKLAFINLAKIGKYFSGVDLEKNLAKNKF